LFALKSSKVNKLGTSQWYSAHARGARPAYRNYIRLSKIFQLNLIGLDDLPLITEVAVTQIPEKLLIGAMLELAVFKV